MGRPLNSRYFGEGAEKIGIEILVGNAPEDAYIVKQIGTSRYIVTIDGTEQYVVDLVKTTEEADNMKKDQGAIFIRIDGELKVVSTIWSKTAKVETGHIVQWVAGGTRTNPMTVVGAIEPETPEITLQYAYDNQATLSEPYKLNDMNVFIGDLLIVDVPVEKATVETIVTNAEEATGAAIITYGIADSLTNIEANSQVVADAMYYDITGQTDFVDPTEEQITIIKAARNAADLTINGQPAPDYVPPTIESYTLQEVYDNRGPASPTYKITSRDVNLGDLSIAEYNQGLEMIDEYIDGAVEVIAGENVYTYTIKDTLASIETNMNIVDLATSYEITGQTDFVSVTNTQATIIKGASNVGALTIDGEPAIDYIEPEEG